MLARSSTAAPRRPETTCPVQEGVDALQAWQHTFSQALALPFDTARMQYAHAVRLGIIERSMLRSRAFEAMLMQLEQSVLGPWARRS